MNRGATCFSNDKVVTTEQLRDLLCPSFEFYTSGKFLLQFLGTAIESADISTQNYRDFGR